MRGAATLVGLLIVLGAGYVVYQKSLPTGSVGQVAPQEQIDLIGVRAELLSIGQAERQYLLQHGAYGTLDQLTQDKMLIGADRRGYTFTVTVDGSRGFTATARPARPDRAAWPTLAMDETMQISQR
jgi:hypothetical protein